MTMPVAQEEIAAAEICEIGRRLWQRGLIAAFDGNLSVRLKDHSILCTPTGVSKGFLNAGELVRIDMDGKVLAGEGKPSSEIGMHLEIYRSRPNAGAIVHAHPPYATAFAVTGKEIPGGIMPEVDLLLGRVPLLNYATPGTPELGKGFSGYFEGSKEEKPANVFLLSNHGATTIGRSLEEAWHLMESLDHCCHILLEAGKLGEAKPYK